MFIINGDNKPYTLVETLVFPNQVIVSAFRYWVSLNKGVCKIYKHGVKMGWGGELELEGKIYVGMQHSHEPELIILGQPQPSRYYESHDYES